MLMTLLIHFRNKKNLKIKGDEGGNDGFFIIKQIKKPRMCSVLL